MVCINSIGKCQIGIGFDSYVLLCKFTFPPSPLSPPPPPFQCNVCMYVCMRLSSSLKHHYCRLSPLPRLVDHKFKLKDEVSAIVINTQLNLVRAYRKINSVLHFPLSIDILLVKEGRNFSKVGVLRRSKKKLERSG